MTASWVCAVVRQDHGDRRVGLAGLASGVDQQQERVAQEPAPSPAIQRQRQPEDHKSETSRFPAKSQQWLRCPIGWVRCGRTPQRHHLRTGTNPQLVLTPSEHRRRYSTSQRRKSLGGLAKEPGACPAVTVRALVPAERAVGQLHISGQIADLRQDHDRVPGRATLPGWRAGVEAGAGALAGSSSMNEGLRSRCCFSLSSAAASQARRCASGQARTFPPRMPIPRRPRWRLSTSTSRAGSGSR